MDWCLAYQQKENRTARAWWERALSLTEAGRALPSGFTSKHARSKVLSHTQMSIHQSRAPRLLRPFFQTRRIERFINQAGESLQEIKKESPLKLCL